MRGIFNGLIMTIMRMISYVVMVILIVIEFNFNIVAIEINFRETRRSKSFVSPKKKIIWL